MADPAFEIASTIQAASIKRHPDPNYDINPSTAASLAQPLSPVLSASDSSSVDSDSTIPLPPLRAPPRRANLPPLPDLRFEQSYLASIRHAQDGRQVAWITFRDQVMMPLMQGTIWALVLHGWRHWNRGVNLHGQSIGARLRRWWYSVNEWKIPEVKT